MLTDTTIPNGYKRTDAGIIPSDWEVKSIEQLCVSRGLVRGPFGGSLRKEVFVESGKKVYEQKNAIYRDERIGTYYIDNSKFNELKRFEVKEGDFIVSCSGTIGRIFQIPRNSKQGIINQALLKMRTDESVINDQYFYYYFDWDEFQIRITDNTQGGAMKNLVGMSVFKNTRIAFPPTKAEQTVIANALSDVDALNSSLEGLIAKKRNIKQGAMQELLTGKKRLPGFNGMWEVKKLGDIGTFSKGKGIRKNEIVSDGLPCIRYGEIYSHHNDYIKAFYSCIPVRVARQSRRLREGDLLFAGSGETAEEIGKCVAFLGDEEAYAGGDIVILTPVGQDSKYLGYLMNHSSVVHQKSRMGQGDAVVHISARNLAKLELNLPDPSEQAAIAEFLSDMDAEIEQLEQKRDKYRMIKQGMMQELLTGKTRLV